MRAGLRRGALAVVGTLLLASCGDDDDGGGAAPVTLGPAPTATVPPVTAPPLTAPATTSSFQCLADAVLGGMPSDQVDAHCALAATVERILEARRLGAGVAEGIGRVSPGWGSPDPAAAVQEWASYACSRGPGAVGELVADVAPGPGEQLFLLHPLTDFVALVAGTCPYDVAPDELSAAVWSATIGPAPTAEQLRSSLTGGRPAVVAQSLLEGARNPCDVVGNGAVVVVEHLAGARPPTWAQLVLGTAVGAGCEHLLP